MQLIETSDKGHTAERLVCCVTLLHCNVKKCMLSIKTNIVNMSVNKRECSSLRIALTLVLLYMFSLGSRCSIRIMFSIQM